MPADLAWNDENGVAHCYLCGWAKQCNPNMEHIEHEIAIHLRDRHGITLRYRVDDETLERKDIP